MTSDITISFPTDVESAIFTSDFKQAEALADSFIQQAEEARDPYIALEALRNLERLKDMAGIAKAKLLYYLSKSWVEHQIEAPFVETVMEYVGLSSPTVIKRWIKIWEMFAEDKVPDEVREQIQNKPTKELVPIMGALNQGYEISDEQWEEIADASGFVEVSRILRDDVKGMQPRSNAILFKLDNSNGLLYAENQGERYPIARLALHDDNEIVKKAIVRLVNAVGVQYFE